MRGLLPQIENPWFGILALLVMFALFLYLLWRVYRRGSRAEMQRGEQLPLEDGKPVRDDINGKDSQW